jgi:hypothetical protein
MNDQAQEHIFKWPWMSCIEVEEVIGTWINKDSTKL